MCKSTLRNKIALILRVASPHRPRTDVQLGVPVDSLESTHYRSLLGSARVEVDSWRGKEYLKPRGYDCQRGVQLPSGIDVCCVTSGGRVHSRWKPENQDSFMLQAIPAVHDAALASRGAVVVGVFDGHGPRGGEVSRGARDSFAKSMLASATGGEGGPDPSAVGAGDPAAGALVQGLQLAATELNARGRDYSRSGSTAVVCMAEPGRFVVGGVTAAWLGDSRAVLGLHSVRGVHRIQALTQDHKPEDPREMARIVRSGGRVVQVYHDAHNNPVGPFRVCFPNTTSPGLAVSRALGDTLASSIGVSATPDVGRAHFPAAVQALAGVPGDAVAPRGESGTGPGVAPPFPPPRHVLVVASDGLWQWIGDAAAVDIAAAAGSAEEAAAALLDVARLRWAMVYHGAHVDDITVAVAFLPAL
ncbi:putative protein phosphatase 2C 6 [Auxenochlorella protothecoides]|uniref:protein-serine/threonine phosphatase n=1 Tax=Auxenochlorella protothecoides TaxID=3075 RepID=A0A087SGY9_AUXPR|nr:putative protein phosphatase 2C 6 [Auxenochlorella protothecoides]KFM24993.1 putative protein phosphatase 2C 6 [Auxenochlorella protothecoides]